MVSGWRKLFDQGEFPFYIVGMPAFQHRRGTPGDDSWAEMREAQAVAARTVPHSCLAVIVDTGDPDNIHPADKKEAGDRLALCALAEHYGRKLPYIGPTLASVERLPGALKLNFEHTDGGLVVKGEKPGEFAVAGDDRQWQWADARVQGNAGDCLHRRRSRPEVCPVRLAGQPGGHALQRCRAARGAFSHGRLARPDGSQVMP